jgi:chemotaxis protein methyltransferase CheR
MNDQEYSFLKDKVYELTGLDINCYKSQQMRRRLEAYLLKNKYPTLVAYCSALEKSSDRRRELLDYMAINVSEFYRDITHFQTLQNEILPRILATHRVLNIWSAACSCGQEPYSLAMVLEETHPGYHRILATDIDESALIQARNGGPYLPNDVRNVDKNLLGKYFIQNEAGYWVNDRLKKKVVFQRHNLLRDPFEGNFDLIVCRNVIIYFSEIVRDELYRKFNNSLATTGVLFLGGSEVVLRPGHLGYSMLLPSFYRRSDYDPEVIQPSRDLSEVVK